MILGPASLRSIPFSSNTASCGLPQNLPPPNLPSTSLSRPRPEPDHPEHSVHCRLWPPSITPTSNIDVARATPTHSKPPPSDHHQLSFPSSRSALALPLVTSISDQPRSSHSLLPLTPSSALAPLRSAGTILDPIHPGKKKPALAVGVRSHPTNTRRCGKLLKLCISLSRLGTNPSSHPTSQYQIAYFPGDYGTE